MSLFALGLNYHSAPLTLRERVAIATEALPQALSEIRAVPGISEAAILSTCNRTEIFTVGGASQGISQWLSKRGHVAPEELDPHLFSYDDQRAVRHALRVAAGLDSMILGEPQILGQMKDAFRIAREHNTLGPILTRLFEHAFHVAKDVRTRTEIGARSVSVASAAARLTGEIFADLKGRDVLVIGAGDTARLVTEHLYAMGQPRITVANRTPERARNLAAQFQGSSCELDDIATQLPPRRSGCDHGGHRAPPDRPCHGQKRICPAQTQSRADDRSGCAAQYQPGCQQQSGCVSVHRRRPAGGGRRESPGTRGGRGFSP